MKPFQQLPFAAVPERPRASHPYAEAHKEIVRVATRAFGDIDVRVVRHGSGPPVVCIHGFMTTSYSFRYLLEPLGRTHTVVAFDLVGAGQSSRPDASYDPDRVADSIGDTLDALSLRGAPVIGNSLGGYLAMRLALRDPGSMSRLVCLHAPGLPTPRMWALRAALSALPGWRRLLRWMVARDVERWVHRNVHYYDETLKSREEHREYAAPLRSPEGLNAFVRMLDETLDVRRMAAFESQLERLGGSFPIPLLLVYARRDPMVPPVVGERLSKLLPGAGFVWLDEASHFAHVDAPGRFLDAALPFLEADAGT